ncbi:Putative N(4)-(beta-N-acetylglucosaminyl)-L-asparaginase [Toxocara canis]|uniref:Putative N(4)-(Beta-N-acetylglucosaminyl)-L-asparaginase n=1 Tax=Toxocara canis TaxID=6265 RepID=A0A0B2V5Y4_TOXCA|nr:Putative N(4)-(beta-N-acetylglucosaminyl)-L-asparaginase [Toxocara canis]
MSKRVLLICCSFTVLLLDAHQLVITTWSAENFQRATARAWKTLRKSDDRIESLLDGLSECERLQCDGTVGFGGSPDETGETRLDALVFDGPGHKMGAVGSLRRVRAAARVAYAVMKYTKHSFLVGEADVLIKRFIHTASVQRIEQLSHVSNSGKANMVDVTKKAVTIRTAIAQCVLKVIREALMVLNNAVFGSTLTIS